MIQEIRQIAAQLTGAYPQEEAEALAWWIMEESTGLTRSQILTGCKGTTNFSNLQEIIERILHFEPIQYVFGHCLWCGLDLKVTPATLIPRPETAELVERIQNTEYRTQTNNASLRVLDIGTGSGCIAIALKKAHPEWEVTGIDFSTEAVNVAKENATRNGADVHFQVADIFSDDQWIRSSDSIEKINHPSFDLIVSNPPYICEREKADMRPNVLEYEPHTALFVPDNDPLKFYRRIAELFSQQSVLLFFEINEAYPQELKALLETLDYTNIEITRDIYGKARIIQARSAR